MQDCLDGEYMLDTLKCPPPWFCIGESAMVSSYDRHDAVFGGRLRALHGRHAGVAWHGLLANGMAFGHKFCAHGMLVVYGRMAQVAIWHGMVAWQWQVG